MRQDNILPLNEMTEYEKKWLWVFLIVEAIAAAIAKVINLLIDNISIESESTADLVDVLAPLILPIFLIIAALIVLIRYRNCRDGE